jgi:cation:H+ antiporter
MADVLTWSIIFIVSLFILIKASDYFTDAAEKIGLYFGLPSFIIGVTIVAFGTSLPEIASSIIAVLKGSSEIVVGNVVGSNITNIFLVLGVSAIMAKKLTVNYELIHVDLPLLISSAFLIAVLAWDGNFTPLEALLCLVGLFVYLYYAITSKSNGETNKAVRSELAKLKKEGLHVTTWLTLAVSVMVIYFGAKYTIESIIQLSTNLNIGKEIIAVTAVALGTSLPELMVSITAARKGKSALAVGNVLGSNIFNAFAVMGIPALVGTLVVPQSIIAFSLPLMIIASLLYFFIAQDKEITHWEGWILILFYIVFIGKTFALF